MANSSNSGTKLAREIYDEFLVCKICLESYKTPKCLSCLHTFCEECIESNVLADATYKKYADYRRFLCPLCHKTTQLPVGGAKRLTDNFLVSNLSALVRRQRPSQYPYCDLCKILGGKHREALSKCLDCNKLLCSPCVSLHRQTKVTQNHSLFDVETEKDIECKEHEGEAIRFYCALCETCVCILCTFQEHHNHDVTSFKEAAVCYKEQILKMLGRCHEKISNLELQVDSLIQCEQIIRNVEQQIRDAAIELIRDVRIKEHQLIEELHTIYGPECLEFIESRKELSSQLENLRNTCSLSDLVINGKDIELLLLKNDVQEKLTALASTEVKSLPKTITKSVQFNAATYVDLGTIQDQDRPLTSTMRIPRNGNRTKETTREPSPPPQPKVQSVKEVIKHTQGTQTEIKETTEAAVQTLHRTSITQKEPLKFSKPAKNF